MTGYKLNLIYINVAKQDQMFYISRASMPHVVQGSSEDPRAPMAGNYQPNQLLFKKIVIAPRLPMGVGTRKREGFDTSLIWKLCELKNWKWKWSII